MGVPRWVVSARSALQGCPLLVLLDLAVALVDIEDPQHGDGAVVLERDPEVPRLPGDVTKRPESGRFVLNG